MIKMKYKKVLLVIPPNNSISKEYLPSLGILYIAAVLKKNGIDVSILDCPIENYSCQDAINYINNNDFDLIGMTAVTDTRYNALKIICGIKKSKVVVGGVHFTFCDIETLKKYKNILCVVRFEGEYTMLEICQGKELSSIKGITYRKGRKIIRNPDREFIDLDDLPYPARELIPMEKYTAKLEGEDKTRCTSIVTSRGCPNNCIFCANKAYWRRKVRFRNPKSVVNEMEFIVKKYGIRGFDIWDDTFTVSKDYVKKLCNEILKRNLKIRFYARIRVDTIDEELLSLMKKAGCVAVSYGVETGSERILKRINKNITFEQVFRTAKIIKKLGLYSKAFFMFNHPTERYSDLIKTFKLMNLLKKKYNTRIEIGITTVYPGTDLEFYMKKQNKLKRGFEWNSYYNRLDRFLGFQPTKVYYKNLNRIFIFLLYYLYFKLIFRFFS